MPAVAGVLVLSGAGVLAVGADGGTSSVVGAEAAGPASPPILPTQAAEPTDEGATWFAGYWLDSLGYARQTLDGSRLPDLALPGCRTCAEFLTQIESDRVSAIRYDGGVFRFLSGESLGGEVGRSALIDVTFTESALTVRNGTGKVVDSVPEHASLFRIELQWGDTGWRVASAKLGDIR